MSLDRRDFLKLSSLAGVSLFLAGCEPLHLVHPQQVDIIKSEKVLRASLANPVCIDPYNPYDVASVEVCQLLFEPLLRYDYSQGALVPGVAESWSVSDDGLAYTFYLREGAAFSDDEPVTARTFKNAWERLLNPATDPDHPTRMASLLSCVSGYEEFIAGETDELYGIQIYGDYHLDVILDHPYPEFPYVLAHPALSPVPSLASNNPSFSSSPVGNGPYRIEGEWVDGQHIYLRRNDSYNGSEPTVDRIELMIFRDEETAYLEYLAGNIDVASIPLNRFKTDSAGLAPARDGYTLTSRNRLISGSLQATCYLVLNSATPALQSLGMRQAISLAIDRDTMCTNGFAGVHEPAQSIIPPDIPHKAQWDYCRYDTKAAAEAILSAQGVGAVSAGQASALRLCYGDDAESEVAALAVGKNLEALGVSVTLEVHPWEEYEKVLEAGDFDIALCSWSADVPLRGAVLDPLFSPASPYNYGAVGSNALTQILEQARGELDDTQREALYDKAEETAASMLQLIPLYHPHYHETCSGDIESLYFDPAGYRHFESAVVSE